MPQIIGQHEQQTALKEIKASLKEMEHTNNFLEHANETGKYTILFTAKDGTRCRAVAHAEKREEIDRLVLHHKQIVAEHVVNLAATNRISLDIDEKVILNLDLTQEEQDILEARALAELEEAEQFAAQNTPAGNTSEQDFSAKIPPEDAPFYATEEDIH